MSYNRVVPRDFFNEAKLLKSLGRLSLYILDNKDGISKYVEEHFDNNFFDIEQTDSGDIYCVNYEIIHKNSGTPIDLYSLLNSKDNYPLVFIIEDINEDYEYVFDDDGNFTDYFLEAVRL